MSLKESFHALSEHLTNRGPIEELHKIVDELVVKIEDEFAKLRADIESRFAPKAAVMQISTAQQTHDMFTAPPPVEPAVTVGSGVQE